MGIIPDSGLFLGKVCTRCGYWRSWGEYSPHPLGYGNRQTRCRSCIAEVSREYRAILSVNPTPPWSEKRCSRCGTVKSAAEFFRNRCMKEGLSSFCKPCAAASSKDYYARTINVNREEKRERHRLASLRYLHRNREKVAVVSAEWRKRFPEKNVAKENRRRTRIKGGGGSYTAEEWLSLCEKYGNRCLACGQAKRLTVDHVIPVSKGGSSNISNLQPLCQKCNCSKGMRVVDYRF